MKKIVINVTSFLIIVAIMAVLNRATIVKETYSNEVWTGKWTECTITFEETMLFSGELISSKTYEGTIFEDFNRYLRRKHNCTRINRLSFR